jgi:hypothetical protein
MTRTKQLPGHFYRLLDLLWQLLTPGRPIPTNSTGKKHLLESITGTGIAQALASNADLVGLLRPVCPVRPTRSAHGLHMSRNPLRPGSAKELSSYSIRLGNHKNFAHSVLVRRLYPNVLVRIQSVSIIADNLFAHPALSLHLPAVSRRITIQIASSC